MMTIEVLTDGVIRLPKELTGSMGIRAGDRLECIYGAKQIGLCLLNGTESAETIFSPKNTDKLFWEIRRLSGREICAYKKTKGGGIVSLSLRMRAAC